MSEKRKDVRTGVEIVVKIAWNDNITQETTSFNYSHGGMLVKNSFTEVPRIGTSMTVQVTTLINGNEAPILPVIVVRASQDEIALQFI